MITIEALHARIAGLSDEELARWIEAELVRPDRQGGTLLFQDIDVARIRLIRELRDELEVEERTLPVVLSLLDRLHDTRRQMRALAGALQRGLPPEQLHRVFEVLREIS